MKKLEIVQKEVGGCLISYNVRLACVRKLEVIWSDVRVLPRGLLRIDYHELMSESPGEVEVLWQLKRMKSKSLIPELIQETSWTSVFE